ncbi:MAG: hypothetical protein IPO92_16435 [Saprospiraceae bacterium]|nr:hypothetical protein [Saprospiraceae bacterium]
MYCKRRQIPIYTKSSNGDYTFKVKYRYKWRLDD